MFYRFEIRIVSLENAKRKGELFFTKLIENWGICIYGLVFGDW